MNAAYQISEAIAELLMNELNVPAQELLDREVRLDALSVDSLSLYDMLTTLENEYSVHIEDEELKGTTINSLAKLVATRSPKLQTARMFKPF